MCHRVRTGAVTAYSLGHRAEASPVSRNLGESGAVVTPLQPRMERVLISTPASLTLARLPPQLAVDGCTSAQDAAVANSSAPFVLGHNQLCYEAADRPRTAVSSPDGDVITGQCTSSDRCYILRVETRPASSSTALAPHSLRLATFKPPLPPGGRGREVRGMSFSPRSSCLAVTCHSEGPEGLRTQVLLLDAQARPTAESALFGWGEPMQWNLQAGFQWSPQV